MKLIRRIALYFLRNFNPGDIAIKHQWTGDKLKIHSYRHKGYWFHGRRRESTEMRYFAKLLQPGNTAIDVGGHIGYLSLYFSKLVTKDGLVHVFEPGANNLPYIRENIGTCSNITLIDAGVSNKAGILTFYEENLSGQNNSFLKRHLGYEENCKNAYVNVGAKLINEVKVMSLDEYCQINSVSPDFIKIDVEGFEFEVLQGAEQVLSSNRPILMVEVVYNSEKIKIFLENARYRVFENNGATTQNYFYFPEERFTELHNKLLSNA